MKTFLNLFSLFLSVFPLFFKVPVHRLWCTVHACFDLDNNCTDMTCKSLMFCANVYYGRLLPFKMDS